MGKTSPSPPPAPDPVATANAQGAMNKETAIANAQLNRVNQVTPYGSLTYTDTPTDSNPLQQTSTVSLSPDQQRLLESSNTLSQNYADLGNDKLASLSAALKDPLSYSSAPQIQTGTTQKSVQAGDLQRGVDMSKVPELVSGDALAGQSRWAQDAAYQNATGYLDPQWKQSQAELESKLANQGVMQNSEAWNRAADDQARQKEFAYAQARSGAVNQGLQAQNQLFNQGLAANQNAFGQGTTNANMYNDTQNTAFTQGLNNAALANAGILQDYNMSAGARGQAINELTALRANPLNEINALRTGSQVSTPTFNNSPQVNMASPDFIGATNANYQGQLNAYNAQTGSNNSFMSGLMGVAGTVGGSMFGANGLFGKPTMKQI